MYPLSHAHLWDMNPLGTKDLSPCFDCHGLAGAGWVVCGKEVGWGVGLGVGLGFFESSNVDTMYLGTP